VPGKTYEVFFGAQGNTVTTLQRKGGPGPNTASKQPLSSADADDTIVVDDKDDDDDSESNDYDKTPAVTATATGTNTNTRKEGIHVTVPSRVCQERAWTTYWICLTRSGTLAAGVGTIPGEQCIAVLTDTDNAVDTVVEVVDGVPAAQYYYVGLGNAAAGDRQPPSPLKVRNVRVTTVPDFVETRLDSWTSDDNNANAQMDMNVGMDVDDAETQALMKEYQEECRKGKARALKFGVAYKEPAPDAFLPWSQARRLRANPKQGFITGLDLYDPAEKAKQDARKRRFGGGSGGPDADADATEDAKDESKQEGATGMETEATELPFVQGWDNEAFVRAQRQDPPASLWKDPPSEAAVETPKSDFVVSEAPATLVTEKIFIFSIDWAAFKQMRTNDLMAHFSIYGPTYVEWLGDLSCNILFEDQFSAKRALESLSRQLPTPPPPEVVAKEEAESPPDLGNMGWRLCNKAVRKVANDRYGRRGTTARLLMRAATSLDVLKERPSSWPKPPPGFTTKHVLGPGSDFEVGRGRKQQKRSRPDRDSERQDYEPTPVGPDGEHPLLSGGLRSSR
jgi:hypothetical protein